MKHDYLAKELSKALDPDFKPRQEKANSTNQRVLEKRKVRPQGSGSLDGILSFELVEFGIAWKFPKPDGRPLPVGLRGSG